MGTTTDFFEHYRYARDRAVTFTAGAPFSDVYDAVLGSQVAAALGYRMGQSIIVAHGVSQVSFVRHEAKPFRIVGILAQTGTPVDRTVLVSLEAIEAIHSLWKEAPVVPELHGRKVRLPGFVVPLDMDARSIGEFLLVPYYGACIHVPPPPRNQTVYVVTAKGQEYRGGIGVMDAVSVTGTLTIETQSTDMGDSGYRIDAVKLEIVTK